MEKIEPVLLFIKNVLLLTVSQLLAIFGVFFLFGLLLYLLARFTRVTFVKSIGQKFDIYITGWIGTPIHELGHAIFCIPFGHRITEIKLFSPNSKDGSLGYVNHSYKPSNIWHNIGNFFIGFGPILFGSFIIFLLIKYLVPHNTNILNLIATQKINLLSWQGLLQPVQSFAGSAKIILTELFSSSNLNSWQFWVFLYLALSISSHMELSPPDLKGLGSGLLTIVILLIIINAISLFFNVNITQYILKVNHFNAWAAGIFTFATLCSALFFVSSYLILNLYSLIVNRKVFHPF